MKTLISKVGFLAAAGLMAVTFTATASAQDANLMRFHVPFAFLAGNQTMPAGDYVLKVDPRFNLVDILPSRGTKVYRVALKQDFVRRPHQAAEGGLLTFAKYGDKLVLRGVWANGKPEGHEVQTSKAEIELARSTGGSPAGAEGSVMVR
jgi:hypothetical protein